MTEEHRSDDRSIDEILAEARAELDKTPDEPQQAAEPGTPEPDDFTPDFGHTFDDYGEFEEPQPEEELPPEPPRKRHKRIVPLFVKIILYVVIVAVVSVGAGYAAWACATDVLAFGRSSDTIQVTVPENALARRHRRHAARQRPDPVPVAFQALLQVYAFRGPHGRGNL